MKTITVSCYKHMEYLPRVLTALEACRGVEEYTVYFSVDGGGDPDVPGFIETWAVQNAKRLRVLLMVHNVNLGFAPNTLSVIQLAFQRGSAFNVHLEDDTVPATDCLLFYEYCADQYAYEPAVFSVSPWNRSDAATAAKHYWTIARRERFNACGGFGMWADRFEEAANGWLLDKRGWDWSLDQVRGARCEVYPLTARVQNIGAFGGHVRDAEWFHATVTSPCGSWSYPDRLALKPKFHEEAR